MRAPSAHPAGDQFLVKAIRLLLRLAGERDRDDGLAPERIEHARRVGLDVGAHRQPAPGRGLALSSWLSMKFTPRPAALGCGAFALTPISAHNMPLLSSGP